MLPGPAPEQYLAAVRAWRTATTAWSKNDAARAGDSFFEAAQHLIGGHPEPIARTFAAGRCLSYENAARAWAAAGRWDDAQEKLTSASAADPECAHSIAGALLRLSDQRPKPSPIEPSPRWRPL
jgi:hypothetical protein